MRTLLASIESEYRRSKALADAAIAQLSEPQLSEPLPRHGHSVAVVVWHVAGNLASRFTDFLETDGEKAWRRRDEEFAPRTATRSELTAHWERGWRILFECLAGLTDAHLSETVRIRHEDLQVHEALHRSLAHTSYHVGQIVYLAKSLCGSDWHYLSIPPGESGVCNQDPRSGSSPDTGAHTTTKRSVEPRQAPKG